MSMKALGPSFDVHLGGEDLIFPHHEDEIAQSEGAAAQAPGRRFVKYWIHGAHLLVEGRKMSKSLGNFLTVRDLLAQGFSGREIRYALLQAHYRESFNFTLEGLRGGRTALARLDECLGKLREVAGNSTAPADPVLMAQFSTAMDEDLNVSGAWGAIFEWIRDSNRLLAAGQMNPAEAAAGLAAWTSMDSVMGITKVEASAAPAALQKLLEQRDAARKARDFQRADAIRGELKAQGWAIEDTAKGARLKRL
jgi:cysteinyl-tRNA synthetase